MTELCLGRHNTHTHLLTPDGEPVTDQSMGINKVQLGEAISFIRLLTGAEMIKDSCITKANDSLGDSSQVRKPGAHPTACRQLKRLESVLPRCLSWSKHLPGSWSDLRVFFVARHPSV